MSLLEVEGLGVAFGDAAPVVDGVSFSLEAGAGLGLLGVSGSGKSLTALAVLGLLPPGARAWGSVRFDGREILGLPGAGGVRGSGVALVFQEPFAALNPLMRVGDQVAEGLRLHRGLDRARALEEASGWLERVELIPGAEAARRYPHQLSGGMRQRALLALALAPGPRLLIADEPTTALDAAVQARIVGLLEGLRREIGFALLVISHDPAVVHALAREAMVMERGRVVERGPLEGLIRDPGGAAARLARAAAALA